MAEPRQTRIRGFEVARPAASALQTESVRVTVKAEFRPGRSRAGTERLSEVQLSADELLEIEYEDDLRLWLTKDEYEEKLDRQGTREATEPGVLVIPDTLVVGGAEATSRGVVAWVLKSLKIIGIDVGKETARDIAAAFESKRDEPRRIGLGLFRCEMLGSNFALESLPAVQGAAKSGRAIGPERCLIFLHGTASSTHGSFGDLWSPQRAATLDGLRRLYGRNVFAFEHRSMTESPIDNALELAKELDARVQDGTVVDLISHSRGGLVGELMCRMTVANGAAPFDEDDIGLAGSADWLKAATDLTKEERKTAAEALKGGSAKLIELGAVLAELRRRSIRIRRFVRVACPALGTTLVSRRLDRWAQILLNVGSLAAKGTPIAGLVESLGDFLAVLIRQKTRPEVLPGLAAMLPDAGLLRSINSPVRPVGTELAVIAGDLEAESIWKRLLTLIADKFFAGEHDLVVNTGSMYGGAPRAGGYEALLAYQSGDAVNHFNYFKNDASAIALLRALETTDFAGLVTSEAGFESMRPPVKPIAREIARGPAGPRPIVFVLPGIMGSELVVGGTRIWINLPELFLGGLTKLRFGASDVRTKGLYERYYAALVDYLADTHKVIPFPYDWRLSPDVEARRLGTAVREAVLEAGSAGLPVRIVAHSMGGLVARSMIAQHPEVWKSMTAVNGARLVMLGTPNGGSHSINELIVGQASTIRRLALADVRNSKRALLDVITRFPGVLSLLPSAKDGDDDYLSARTWDRYAKTGDGEWIAPGGEALQQIREFHDRLARSAVDPKAMVYVAGQAPETLVSMRLVGGRIVFKGTNRGDGQVPWDSGIPAGLKAWYLPGVVHGNLPSADEHFPALLDLLRDGTTTRLPREEPVSRAAVSQWDIERGPEEMLPDEDAIVAAALGGPPPRARRRKAEAARLRVSVVHGHLRFADWPVMVGHYRGDVLVSAEKVLDAELEGRLTHRHRLGLYPGELKTCQVVLRRRPPPSTRWRGAIVVGLGQVGELGVGGLAATIAHGALTYAAKLTDRDCETTDDDTSNETMDIGISSLLIGSNEGGVSARDAVLAVLEGIVVANQELREAGRPIRISSLQLVEVLQSKALLAVEDLQFLAEKTRFKGLITVPTRVDTRRGARSQLVFKESEGWWQRLQIKGEPELGEAPDGALRFVALTRRARAESRLVATQRALVETFVKQSISSTRNEPDVCRTLFELLIPNAIKEQSPNRDNLVLVLDEEAARFPWEMLANRWDDDDTPLALNRGLLRQLELKTFRETPLRSSSPWVLVVGNPKLSEGAPFAPLPGARAEACAVAALFEKDKQFKVVPQIEESAAHITQSLFAQPYRIVHLAGHGVYQLALAGPDVRCDHCGATSPATAANRKDRLRTVTGMVLGDNAFLTPREVEQMRRVPEIVFINCCHLGYIEGQKGTGSEDQSPGIQFNAFAANVATQFMRIGVRAVVAAGWAVDDGAARAFAVEFYTQMLAGRTFGEAVLTARQKTAEQHPHSNTWGAYQCYGDPGYFLVDSPPSDFGRSEQFASLEQLINRVEGILAEIDCAGDLGLAVHLSHLDDLKGLLAADRIWSHHGRAWVGLARAYNAAYQFEAAVECYQKSLLQEDGGLTIHDIEQWTNCECRIAISEWRAFEARAGAAASGSQKPELATLRDRVDRAIERLLALHRSLQQDAVTSERLAILGSAYKRRALLYPARSERATRVRALQESMSRYKEAASRKAGRAFYPLLNWAALDLVLRWHGETPVTDNADAADLDAKLELARAGLEAAIAEELDVWGLATRADMALLIRLRSDVAMDEMRRAAADKELRDAYREVRRLANEREYQSILEQFEFLSDMAKLTDASGGERYAELVGLRALIDGEGKRPVATPPDDSKAAATKPRKEGARRGRKPASRSDTSTSRRKKGSRKRKSPR
jgi:pimeloyl-ACP methyl ester carboxylesterase